MAAQTTGFGPQQVVTTAVNEPNSVCAFDLDGDGDLDVLSASTLDHKIAWYANQGAGVFGGVEKDGGDFAAQNHAASTLVGHVGNVVARVPQH